MNSHKNARLTHHGRAELVHRVLVEGQTASQVAASFGVCVKTVRKWVVRFEAEGTAGLCDRSSRPHRLHRPTPDDVMDRIAALRRERWTGKRIAAELGVSPATVSRVLRRLGLSRLRDLEPAEPVRRYERERPGELIHLDIKKLGRFERVGHRITGDRRGQSNSRGVGWEYVHVCIDDHSRVAFTSIFPDEKAVSTVAFLRAAIVFYARFGVTVERVMTDNGSCYKSMPSATPARRSASATSAPDPTPQRPTARPSASSRPRSTNGPMHVRMTPRTSARTICPNGFTATIGTDPMAG